MDNLSPTLVSKHNSQLSAGQTKLTEGDEDSLCAGMGPSSQIASQQLFMKGSQQQKMPKTIAKYNSFHISTDNMERGRLAMMTVESDYALDQLRPQI